jgi:hypothetical protein
VKPKVNQPNENRRKILQGSLAAPMVLTVSSASAASVTSFGKCLNRLTTEQPSQFFVGPSSDNWWRKEVPVVRLKHGNIDDWFYFDPGFNEYRLLSSPLVSTGIGLVLDPGWQKKADGTRWALVWVDSQSGAQWSMITAQRPSGYQATTMSCMASVTPGAIL